MRVLLGLMAILGVIVFAAWNSAGGPAALSPRPSPTATPLPFPSVGQQAMIVNRSDQVGMFLAPDTQTLAQMIDAAQRNQPYDGTLALLNAHAPAVVNGTRAHVLVVGTLGRGVPVAQVRVDDTGVTGWLTTAFLEEPLIATR